MVPAVTYVSIYHANQLIFCAFEGCYYIGFCSNIAAHFVEMRTLTLYTNKKTFLWENF